MLLKNLEYPADEAVGEVIHPCTDGIALSVNGELKAKDVDLEESSALSSELIESDRGDVEVQSPLINKRGSLSTSVFVSLTVLSSDSYLQLKRLYLL